MRLDTVTTKVYKFNELSDKAKETALEKLYDINVDYDWWESVYEDAATIGLKITGFDIDRGSYCEGNLTEDIQEVIKLIKDNHGTACDTYILASDYEKRLSQVDGNSEDFDTQMEDITSDFEKDLREEYLSMLRKEYEFQTSEEAITDTIEANEYEFTEDGILY